MMLTMSPALGVSKEEAFKAAEHLATIKVESRSAKNNFEQKKIWYFVCNAHGLKASESNYFADDSFNEQSADSKQVIYNQEVIKEAGPQKYLVGVACAGSEYNNLDYVVVLSKQGEHVSYKKLYDDVDYDSGLKVLYKVAQDDSHLSFPNFHYDEEKKLFRTFVSHGEDDICGQNLYSFENDKLQLEKILLKNNEICSFGADIKDKPAEEIIYKRKPGDKVMLAKEYDKLQANDAPAKEVQGGANSFSDPTVYNYDFKFGEKQK